MEGIGELRGSMATTPGEKCEVLKQRDKLVRAALGLHMKKQTELSEAKVLRGTCQDMCPEMERYIREDRRRLSVYEITQESDMKNQLVDHRLAVKEYSRSSADQDLPLPHELRPGPVLERTMHYLLNNIADTGGDGRWGDWFDFLWNRTRGIRKDITQQQLCDLTVVGLVEKCARFHIYCSERLCEEDMMVFDDKINDENLTKCLQTLKEMYYDLSMRQITCPNEAEFRAYMVLMNLNSGDILREVQQLSEEVRAQPVIGFVVQVYSSLYNNNYLRFYKLVRKASFLNACIMHRYFYQVRMKGLNILCKAYNKKEYCSADELVRVLGFENPSEAVAFCAYHGLQTDESTILMDRAHIVAPETAYARQRAQGLIESKQAVSVGETINGEPLPANIIPEPTQNSFDASGRFVGKDLEQLPSMAVAQAARAVGDQPFGDRITPEAQRAPGRSSPDPFRGRVSPVPPSGRVSPFQRLGAATGRVSPVATATTGRQSPDPTAKQAIPNEIVKDIAKGLFIEVIKEFTENMSQQLVRAVHMYLDYDRPISAQLIDEALPGEMRAIAEKAMLECQQESEEKEARARAELSMRKRRIEAQIADQICEEQVDHMISQLAKEQCRQNEEKLKQASIDRCSDTLSKRLLAEVLQDEIDEVAEEVFESDVTARLEEMAQNARAVERMIQAKYLRKWKNKYAARVRLHKAMFSFPASPCPLPANKQFSQLVPRSRGLSPRGVHLGANKRARLTLDSPLQLSEKRLRLEQHMTLRDYWREVRRDLANAPFDVAQIVQEQLRTGKSSAKKKTSLLFTESKLFFKMLVSVSGSRESVDFEERLITKLSKGAVPNPPCKNIQAKYLSLYHTTGEDGLPLGVCVNAIEDTPTRAQIERLGADSSFLNGVHGVLFVVQNSWVQENDRLVNILRGLRVKDAPSLVVLCPDPSVKQADLEHNLDLAEIQGHGLIASYTVHVMKTSWEQPAASKLVRTVIRQQVSQPRDHYVIDSVPYMEYVEHFLHKHFSAPVYQHEAQKPKANDWTLHDLVELYNNVLESLADLAESENLAMSEVGSSSFQLHSPDHDPRLPSPEDIDPAASAVQQVYAYVQLVAGTCKQNKALLFNRVSHIMGRWKRQQESDIFSDHVTPPWVAVVMACVQCKLNQLSHYCATQEQDHGGKLFFRRSSLQSFRPPPLPLNLELQYPEVKSDSTKLDKTPAPKPRKAFNPWFLRDELLQDIPQHSVASSMICHASTMGDDTQHSMMSSDYVINSSRSTPIPLLNRDETLRDSSKSYDVTFTIVHDLTADISEPKRAYDEASDKLTWSIAREKNKNEQFEKYLKAMLDGDSGLTRMDVN